MLPAHPAADTYPLMDGAEFDELVDDIRRHGLRHPIVTHEGKILDGRNREAACTIAGKAPRYVEWDGKGDPLEYVVSVNGPRRHLKPDQRVWVAVAQAKYRAEAAEKRSRANLKRGESREHPVDAIGDSADSAQRALSGKFGKTAKIVARAAGLSARTVERAQQVQEQGCPKLLDAVKHGEVTIRDAAAVVAEPPEAIAEALKAVREGRNAEPPRKITLAGFIRAKAKPEAVVLPLTMPLPRVAKDDAATQAAEAISALGHVAVTGLQVGDGFAVVTFSRVATPAQTQAQTGGVA